MEKKKILIDKIFRIIFAALTILSASIIVFIVVFILIKGSQPFINKYTIEDGQYSVNLIKFIFGLTWFKSPNVYSVGFIVINTIYIVLLSSLIAVPVSVLTALFIVKIAPKKIGMIFNYVVDVLAGIPSIIYGLFGMGIITQFVKGLASIFGIQTAGGLSTLATVLVLAIMIMPTITMLSITSIKAVKKEQEYGSLALGASQTQTNFKIVLHGAKSGIFAAIILGIGRALGESTAVSMVAGNRGSGIVFNLFSTTRTLTSTMLLGIKETVGLDYDIRFSVGIVLIILIIASNLFLNQLKRGILK